MWTSVTMAPIATPAAVLERAPTTAASCGRCTRDHVERTVTAGVASAVLGTNPTEQAPRIQKLADGAVTLLPLEQLQACATSAAAECLNLQQTEDAGRASASDKLAEAGAALVEAQTDWHGTQQDSDLVAAATALVEKLRADDGSLEELDQHKPTGLKHLVQPFTRYGKELRDISSDRTQASAKLRPLLIQLAQQAPATTVPPADDLRHEALALQQHAAGIEQSIAAKQAALSDLMSEIAHRQEVTKQYGFDALLTLGSLEAYGPKAVSSPLVLKKGEQAYLSWPAGLARHVSKTTFVGGSQGMSFPIGHTGIRYRLGTFKGHPVTQDVVRRVDDGTLVLTDQRIVFIGASKSTSTPLSKLLHVEVYTDGLGVFQEGRENPNIYLIGQSAEFMLYVNFLLDRTGRT
jgi:hypothetical protein